MTTTQKGVARVALPLKKRSSKIRNAKKEKPPLTKESHLSVEAKDTEVPLSMASQMIPRYATGEKVRFEGKLDEYGDMSWINGIIKELIPPGDPRNPLENLTRMYLMHQLDGDRTISGTYVAKDSITGEEVRWPKKEKRKNGPDNLSSQHPSRP
jgi:hypothetical protein